MRLRRTLGVVGLLAALVFASGAAADQLTLDIPAARELARSAALSGRPDIAKAVALGLLQRDPNDSEALLALASAELQLAQPKAARKAAVLAFRTAPQTGQRYVAARLAAQAAFNQKRLTLAQYWLRRASQTAPDPAQFQDTVTSFRQVQAQNPWRNSASLSFSPTSNVNNGSTSESDRLYINGIPSIFILSRDARALSGYQFGLDLGTSYRISATPRSLTEIGVRLVANEVILSDAAKQQAPGARASDYAYRAAELSLTHRFALRRGKMPVSLVLVAGRNWYGGDGLTSYGRLQSSILTPLPEGFGALRWQFLAERQWAFGDSSNKTDILSLQAQYDWQLRRGDRLGFRLGTQKTNAASDGADNHGVTAEVTYALAKPLGPVQVTLGLLARSQNYPLYFGIGRLDRQLELSIGMVFPKAQIWGFAPKLELTASKTRSNFSRFESSDVGLQFGMASVF